MFKSFVGLLGFVVFSCAGWGQTVNALSGVNTLPGVGAYTGCNGPTRTLPPGLPTLPMMPACVLSPGNVIVNQNADQAFNAKYPSSASGSYVLWNPATGNDTACGVNSATPCATWKKAVETLTAPIVYVQNTPGVPIVVGGNSPAGYYYTDAGSASGTIAKKIICQNPPCVLRVFGDTIASDTWAAVSGYPGMYSTTIASAQAGTSGGINTVIYQDGTVDGPYVSGGVSYPFADAWGNAFPARLPTAFPNTWYDASSYATGQFALLNGVTCYEAIAPSVNRTPPNATYWEVCPTGSFSNQNDYAGVTTLGGMTSGWYYSSATYTLYVKLGGANMTQTAVASRLRATYFEEGGGQPAVYAYGTIIELEGFYLDGMGFADEEWYDGTNYHPSEMWLQSDTAFNGEGPGVGVYSSDLYADEIVVYAAQAATGASNIHEILGVDSAQANPHDPIVEFVNSVSSLGDDPETWAGVTVPSMVAHAETGHVGFQINLGMITQDDLGSEDAIGNAAAYTQTSLTTAAWWVGSISRNINQFNTSNQTALGTAGYPGVSNTDPRQTTVWVDTPSVYNEPGDQLFISNGTHCYLYNAPSLAIAYITASPCQSYSPSAP